MNILFPATDITIRAFGAIAIITAGLALYWLINRAIILRAQRNTAHAEESLPGAQPGLPTVLYFTTPDCLPCKTIQRPALQRLQERLGDQLQVIEVDAQAQPELANRWGVLSVPTTFILNKHGHLRHVNHGATRVEKLLQQIER